MACVCTSVYERERERYKEEQIGDKLKMWRTGTPNVVGGKFGYVFQELSAT